MSEVSMTVSMIECIMLMQMTLLSNKADIQLHSVLKEALLVESLTFSRLTTHPRTHLFFRCALYTFIATNSAYQNQTVSRN